MSFKCCKTTYGLRINYGLRKLREFGNVQYKNEMLKKGLPRSAQPRTVACIVHGCLCVHIYVSVCVYVYGCPPNPLPPTQHRQSALMQLENALRMFCIACLALLFVLFVSLSLTPFLSPSLPLSLSLLVAISLYLLVCLSLCVLVCCD